METDHLVLSIDSHPLLDLDAFIARFPTPLGDLSSAAWFDGAVDIDPPFEQPENTKDAVRRLLRVSGFKPAGRSKPASEYVRKAIPEQRLPSINAAVDVCNVVSYHSGLPISVVDLERSNPPYGVRPAPEPSEYVFNRSGQVIRVDHLLCLFDREGPCANAVKDAQRTKTSETTREILTVIWGTNELPGYTHSVGTWYRDLLRQWDAAIEEVERKKFA